MLILIELWKAHHLQGKWLKNNPCILNWMITLASLRINNISSPCSGKKREISTVTKLYFFFLTWNLYRHYVICFCYILWKWRIVNCIEVRAKLWLSELYNSLLHPNTPWIYRAYCVISLQKKEHWSYLWQMFT